MQLLNFITVGFKSAGAVAMWLILFIAFGVVGLTIERVWYLFIKCGTGTGTFMSGISKYLKAGEYDKALKYATSVKTPLARAVSTILQNRGKSAKAIQKSLDEVFLTETPKITRNLPLFNTLANSATLLGLMGTIYGLMQAFDAIANVPAAQRATALANGISFAMSTTLFGLIVAVPTMFIQGILVGKSDKIVDEMDEKTTKMVNLLEE